jgi:hypothetical protein
MAVRILPFHFHIAEPKNRWVDIFEKLHVDNRAKAAVAAVERKLISTS